MRFFILSALLMLSVESTLAKVESARVTFGRFSSRGILNLVAESQNAPVVILVTGSGANGPEEMAPASLTVDGRDSAIFNDIAGAFNRAGINTFQIGKPGVNFFTSWNEDQFFYDKDLYINSTWNNLIENLDDAVRYVQQISNGQKKIFILGHSEGTQIAVDYAAGTKSLSGLILLGFFGEDMKTTLEWQLYRRIIDHFVATEIDQNKDGIVTREEAKPWPDFVWSWKNGQKQISYQEIESELRKDPKLIKTAQRFATSRLYRSSFNRGPIYKKTAALKLPLFVFTGSIDLQTRAMEAQQLRQACVRNKKANCYVSIIPGLGHGFSPPRPPRAHPLLDITVGPVAPSFLDQISMLGVQLKIYHRAKN